jgi:3-phosphoshikimate 1-carboxyvinyltransferase
VTIENETLLVAVSDGVLTVHARGPLRGCAAVPGDKSISHRALLVSALSDGPVRIRGLSTAQDVCRTRDALATLGIQVLADDAVVGRPPTPPADEAHAAPGNATVVVHGRGMQGLSGPPVVIDCGNSGTTMRLLAGLLAGQNRRFELRGSPQLSRRPMDRVIRPLQAMGAQINAADGLPPIIGHPKALRPADITLEVASAQSVGAVLLAALSAPGVTTVRIPATVRDHTERMLQLFGAPVEWDGLVSRIEGGAPAGMRSKESSILGSKRRSTLRPPAGGIDIPGDISGAAFILAAGLLVPGSELSVDGVGLNPGRVGFLRIAQAMGARLTITYDQGEDSASRLEPTGRITVNHSPLTGVVVNPDDVPAAIDELPLVAVLATQAHGETRVTGAAELKVKESDRIAATVDGLRRMGADIEALSDGFVVRGPTALHGANVDGCGDHRVVMALAVAGLAAAGTTHVSGATCVHDSFPGFADTLSALAAPAPRQAEEPAGLLS